MIDKQKHKIERQSPASDTLVLKTKKKSASIKKSKHKHEYTYTCISKLEYESILKEKDPDKKIISLSTARMCKCGKRSRDLMYVTQGELLNAKQSGLLCVDDSTDSDKAFIHLTTILDNVRRSKDAK